MNTAITTYRVHKCSKCPGDTEYYCESCPCDLCPQCKENHVKDLNTIDHDVVSHRDKIYYIPTQEICVRHPSNVYVKYCESCELPICYYCRNHICHEKNDVRTAFEIKQNQHKRTIHTIRSEALFNRSILLPLIKADFKTCHTKLSLCQSDMLTKVCRLKDCIHYLLYNLLNNVFCDFDFKHRCLKQQIEMNKHIVSLQEYELRYVQPTFTFSALQFLKSIKTALPHVHLTIHTSQLSMAKSLNKEDLLKSLSVIQITEKGNRRVGNQCLLKLTSGAEFHRSLTVAGVDRWVDISYVTSDRVWVSHRKNVVLTDTTGVPIHCVHDLCIDSYNGLHTVNSESELIYIDRKNNINKLLNDMKTTTALIERTYSSWRPLSVYWSPFIGNLLVGMSNNDTGTGKVTRYNKSGQLIQTIQHDNRGLEMYRKPNYITDNNNGDVVVADCYKKGAVVVTDREGRRRFSYTGHPSGSGLAPRGVCTDALSHILVCDLRSHTVQMTDKDGQFLSHLLIRPSGIFTPYGLSYDVNTHRLWVGSLEINKVVMYSYITRQDAMSDLNPATANVMESLRAIRENKIPQEGYRCLLKLMSSPELLHSFIQTGFKCCSHISCVTPDLAWVSDINNLILTNTTGVILHRVQDLCKWGKYSCNGLHTVNSESELIYIDRKYNINRLSKNMQSTTTFIERTDSTWGPRCVYWSQSTKDLLVGMYRKTGKVTRFNQNGQLTQTIQYDNMGQELYKKPNYITENNNGDVVVSDSDAVVVTDRGGRHRFSYTGPPSGSGLEPQGICTDALSHILVCDVNTKTVHIMDKDGQFLSHLLIKSQELGMPWSLSYDVNTHCLWVGSDNNKTLVIHVYRYTTRQDALTV